MRFALCLLSTAALAHKPSPEALQDHWVVEFITTDGQFSRMRGYPTREACEAAIPAVLKEQGGFNGHCIESDSKSATFKGHKIPPGRDDSLLGPSEPAAAEHNRWRGP